MATKTTTNDAEQRLAALQEELNSLRTLVAKTPAGAYAEQERKRIATRDRNAQIRSLDPAAFVDAVSALPQHERGVGLMPDRALALVRECGDDSGLRDRLLAVYSEANHAHVAWTMFEPPARVRLVIPESRAERTVSVPEVRITPDQADQAEALGLPVRRERGPAKIARLAGFSYQGTHGFCETLHADALDVWKGLHPGVARLTKPGGPVNVEPVPAEESREISRREWFDDGAKRTELPPLP